MKLLPSNKIEKQVVTKRWVLLFENGSTIEIPAESYLKEFDTYQFFDEPLNHVKVAKMTNKPLQSVAEIRADYIVGVFAPHTICDLMEKKTK